MAAFTHYWTNDTCDELSPDWEGEILDHTAGNGFERTKVVVGDSVYAVTVKNGELFLIGKMVVGRIVHSDREAELLLGYEPWSASMHLIADKEQSTVQRFDRVVPLEVVRQLRFEAEAGSSLGLTFVDDARLDRQTLRGVRRLTAQSARLLDSMLEN